MYFAVSLIGFGFLLLATLVKILYKSPTAFHKIQAINAFTTLFIIFLSIYIYYTKETSFIDLALIYVIINYVGMIAIIKFVTFKYHHQNKIKDK
ncbi:monovalent cation/H+ antiporter complex subunit F [Rickettsiales bacterium LUAb2]